MVVSGFHRLGEIKKTTNENTTWFHNLAHVGKFPRQTEQLCFGAFASVTPFGQEKKDFVNFAVGYAHGEVRGVQQDSQVHE